MLRTYCIVILLGSILSIGLSAQQVNIDSLLSVYENEKTEKNKIIQLNKISNAFLQRRDYENFKKYCEEGLKRTEKKKFLNHRLDFSAMYADYLYVHLEFDKSIQMFKTIKSASEKINSTYYKGISYQGFSKNYWRKGNYMKAVYYGTEAIKLFEPLKDTFNIVVTKGNYMKAVYYGTEAIKLFEPLKDTFNIVVTKGNLGTVYIDLENFDKAELLFQEILIYYKGINDISALANTYEKLGAIKFYKAYYASARKYYTNAYNLYLSIQKELEASIELGNIGETYEMEGNYYKAIDYYKRAAQIETKYNYYSGLIFIYQALGRSYFKLRNYSKAKQSYSKCIEFINKIGETRELFKVYILLHELYAQIGNFRKAYEYSLKANEMKDSVAGHEVMNKINEIIIKYETDEKEKENELLRNNQKLKDEIILGHQKKNREQYIVILFIVLMLIIILTGSAFLLRLYRKNKKSHIQLEIKNRQVNDIYSDLTDSIKYAGNIQFALLSSFSDVMPNFSEYFIFYQPSDILSGDFYWSKMINDTIYFASADSTGHGIPGALLSILGMSYLNEIVNTDYILPDTILNNLREKIKHTLNQQGKIGEQKDGWDISVCSLNIKTGEANFAGAFNSLIIISNEKNENPEMKHFTELKADRQPVSVYLKEKPFNNHKFTLKKGDILYFYTDGFPDQISEKDEKKFTSKRFKQLLLSVSKEPLQEQEKMISQTFFNWKGNFDQVDDVLLIGIKI